MYEIFSVIYLSEAVGFFNDEKINKLVENAKYHNQIHGITGFLYYKNAHFFQYIEGEKSNLEQLLLNITNDGRHRILKSLQGEPKKIRRFKGWQMGKLKTNELIQIKQEDVILDYLEMIRKYNDLAIKNDFSTIWRLIDNLAHYKNKGTLTQ